VKNYSIGQRKSVPLAGPAVFLGFGGGAGLWLGLAPDSFQVLLAAAILTLTVVLGAVWYFWGRATRRLHAVVDLYAEREIAREQRLKLPPAL
jgi:hypothetical protein